MSIEHVDDEDRRLLEEEPSVRLVFTSLEAFVTEYLAEVLGRDTTGPVHAWCPDWWRHAAALVRLNAMWRAFEYLCTDGSLGMSTWWLHHADPHLAVLLNPVTGPFAACKAAGEHVSLPALPVTPVAPGVLDNPVYMLVTEDPFDLDAPEVDRP
ncbi:MULTISPECIES: DUF4913 domain-containing protein [Streptomyces]|uniref:DUF4913 domain-containing protein n=1 Tax=Streptomyces solicathayae TaxID=3081768 RepID=A0ABZ0LUR9_9ACTN|nr:DUF4913 domain-containing protein [Streptomyces sp. HUAS YS2]WOX23162.1 DUF4913 domain-containing protein [Streptomyces sp. HUAS YS2]